MIKKPMAMMGRAEYGPAQEPDVLEFTPPEGLDLKTDGGQAMVQWEKTDDDKIRIVSFDGVKIGGGYDMSDEDDGGPPESNASDTQETQ
jgi:hypothetical protein